MMWHFPIPIKLTSITSILTSTYNAVLGIYSRLLSWTTDDSSNLTVLVTESEPHYKIHNSRSYVYSDIVRTIGATTTQDVYLIVPRKKMNLTWQFFPPKPLLLSLYERTELDNEGTPITPVNRERSIATAAVSLLFSLPTVHAVGELLYSKYFNSTPPTDDFTVRETGEWVLADDVNYLLQVTNTSASSCTFQLILNFYEAD